MIIWIATGFTRASTCGLRMLSVIAAVAAGSSLIDNLCDQLNMALLPSGSERFSEVMLGYSAL